MEIFKLFESTMADLQPGHNIKHLRRDQLLDNYEASAKTLQILIQAKQNEIAYRKDLLRMLEESKAVYDSKLGQAKHDYQIVKSNAPESLDIKLISRLDSSILNERSTTPPMPPPPSPPLRQKQETQQSGIQTSTSSLDRRLSEFLKTFPNISQASLVPPSSIDTTKPPPGYYTQQTPQPIPPQQQPTATIPHQQQQHHHHHHHQHMRR